MSHASLIRPTTIDEFLHPISGCVAPLIGFSGERAVVGGTAVLIAPGFAITASHVFEEILAQFGYNQNSKDVKLDIYVTQMHTGASWYVCGSHTWAGTDITVLNIKPRNETAVGTSIDRVPISIDPPDVGSTVTALGYPGTKLFIQRNDNEVLKMCFEVTLMLSSGVVTDVHADYRDRVNIRFPCFAVNAEFSAGMSGGAVFNSEKELCGLVCVGGTGELTDHSYAVSIWPISIIPVMLNEAHTSAPEAMFGKIYKLLELARHGVVDLRGHERIELFKHDNGSDGVRRHHPLNKPA
jgi:Trypsin-like peptidase domain